MALNFLNNGYFAAKVGIGTTPSVNILTVKAANATIDVQSTGDGQTVGLRAGYLNDGNLAGYFRYTTGDAQLYIDNNYTGNNGVYSDINIRNKTASNVLTTRIKIKGSTGNVGIGTTLPTSKLHVQGAATPGTYAAYIHNASGGGNVLKLYNHDWDTSDFLLYATNGGTAANGYGFTVDGNARVNIGLATVATASCSSR